MAMDEYFARDIMKDKVSTIDSSYTVMEAARKMAGEEIGCLVVLEGGSPIGIITERDIVREVVAGEKPPSTQVRSAMSSPLIYMDPDSTIWELAEEMKLRKIHKMPILQGKDLVGIVTTTDITRLCSVGSDSEMRRVCQQILQRIHEP